MATRDNNAEDMALAPVTTTSTTPMPTLSPAASAGEPENIAVCIRVRPLNEREVRSRDCNVLRTISAMNMITITDVDGAPLSGKHNVFQYDHIFDETRSTRHMYNQVARRIVRSTLEGINGTIFAYGQTSSGKTYTMQGSDVNSDSSASTLAVEDAATSVGILQLAVDDIFAYIARCRDRDFLLRVSFVEIYNEIVRDLLVPIGSSTTTNNSGLKLREDLRKGVYVECREEIITSFDDILALLARGNDRRTVGQTAMNDRSSRSHSIFRIVIESKRKAVASAPAVVTATGPDPDIIAKDKDDDAVLVACLSLVDLAGSESVRHTAAEGIRQREAGNINKSLLTLSRVINALAAAGSAGPAGTPVSAQRQSAPFRDSKLTRLLQTSLAGNTRTLIVCCVTPSDRYLDETKSTLQFAARAKTITTSASVNEVLDDQAQLRRLQREVRELKQLVNTDTAVVEAGTNANRSVSGCTTGKRTRETSSSARWYVSDGSASDHHSASPNHQPRRKRRSNSNNSSSNENVMPMNVVDDDDDDDDDDGSADEGDDTDGSGVKRLRRQQWRCGSNSHAVASWLLGLLELALAHYRNSSVGNNDADHSGAADDLDAAVALVHEVVTRNEDQTRLADLLQELQVLAADAAETQLLRRENKLQRIQVRELHRRLKQFGAGAGPGAGSGVGSGVKSDVGSFLNVGTRTGRSRTKRSNTATTSNDTDSNSESVVQRKRELLAAKQQRKQLETRLAAARNETFALAAQTDALESELVVAMATPSANAMRTESSDNVLAHELQRVLHGLEYAASAKCAVDAELTRVRTTLECAMSKRQSRELNVQSKSAEQNVQDQSVERVNKTPTFAARTDTLDSELAQELTAVSANVEQTDSSDNMLAHELQRVLHGLEHAASAKRAVDAELARVRVNLECAANGRQTRKLNNQDQSTEMNVQEPSAKRLARTSARSSSGDAGLAHELQRLLNKLEGTKSDSK